VRKYLGLLVFFIPLMVYGAEVQKKDGVEIAIYHMEEGVSYVLPIISYPFNDKQFEVEEKMWPGEAISLRCKKLIENDISGKCLLDNELVRQHFHMNFIPDKWLSKSHGEFETGNAVFVNANAGGIVGFEVNGREVERGNEGTLLSNNESIFVMSSELDSDDWRSWPLLQSELDRISSESVAFCKGSEVCVKDIKELADIDNFKGGVREVLISEGVKLQILFAESRSINYRIYSYIDDEAPPPGEMTVKLWRIISPNGDVNYISFTDYYFKKVFSGVNISNSLCESQCAGDIELLEFFKIGDRFFLIGEYWTGTVSGYLIIEVADKGLDIKFVYRWGS